MDAKVQLYVPRCFNSFQGFSVKDIKEFTSDRRLEIHLVRDESVSLICNACGKALGHYHDQYPIKVKHLRVFEGNNRAIKGLKWQAYGYKDMTYFALKILQKLGYLNHKYALQWLYQNEATA